MGNEFQKHLAAAHILDTGGELAIGKRARTALTELDVGAFIKRARAPEILYILRAGIHISPALQHEGTIPGACERERCKKARWAEADHNGAQLGIARCPGRFIPVRLRGLYARPLLAGKQLLFAAVERYVDRIDEENALLLFAGVNGFPHDLQRLNPLPVYF